MRELITMAFREVRGIQEIYLLEECSPLLRASVETLKKALSRHEPDYIIIEGEKKSFRLKFFGREWIGVTTDKKVNEVLILAALERAVKFMEKYDQVKQHMEHLREEIGAYFLTHGVKASVRGVDLSVTVDAVSGKIELSCREGRTEAVKEHVLNFVEKQLPYFIKNNISIIIERQSLLDRITRDQLLRIIRRVERL